MTAAVESATERLYHSPLGLFGFQADGIARAYWNFMERSTDVLAIWDTGIGKALRNDQRVSTPQGWKTIGSLRRGDLIHGLDGEVYPVLGVYPQGRRELWTVRFTDGVEVVCDGDHLWNVNTRLRRWKGYPDKTLTLREIRESGLKVWDGGVKHYVPMTSPVWFRAADLPIDPYTLGCLIGDGGLTQGSPRITTMDDDLIQRIPLPTGVRAVPQPPRSQARTWLLTTPRGRPNPLLDSLRSLGCCVRSEQKCIPTLYQQGSVEQRWALLQGLMDTDGYCGSSIEFGTSSPSLADGVVDLVRSLGGTASISRKETAHLPCFTVRMVLPPEMGAPFRIGRKVASWRPRRGPTRGIESIEPAGTGWATCIRVDSPDSLFLTEGYVATHNTHLAMATGAMLFEDGLIDHMVVACESEKLREWVRDMATFTHLETVKYHGTPRRRAKIRASLPQVIVSTYETIRTDIGTCIRKGNRRWPSVDAEGLVKSLAHKRVLFVYDEVTKLKERTSTTHILHKELIWCIRGTEGGRAYLMGLTATPIEDNDEDFYNLGLIFTPNTVGTVKDFERDHVAGYDLFDKPNKFKNRPLLVQKLSPVILRKRKTDADVRDQFPKRIEEQPTYVELEGVHRRFYLDVVETFLDAPPLVEDQVIGVLRMIAGYPRALVRANGKLATEIVNMVGEEGLIKMGSAKRDRLIHWLRPIVAQGDQAIVFTFFGPTMIPFLAQDLTAAGYTVLTNHSQMPQGQRDANKDAFRRGESSVFLTSDAGSRGLNFPNATYVHHYEYPASYARYVQRSDRVHRIDSAKASVTISGMVVADTVEEGCLGLMLARNVISDKLVDHDAEPDEAFMSSSQRRGLLKRTGH